MQTSPTAMPPYCGQDQQQQIVVPRPIVYKETEREESCWVLPPYAKLYPPGNPTPQTIMSTTEVTAPE